MVPAKRGFYLCAPDLLVALNPKAASSVLAYEIMRTHYPLKFQTLHEKMTAAGHDPQQATWHNICPKTTDYAGKHAIVPLREPIDRFCAAIKQTGHELNIDRVLDELEQPPLPLLDPQYLPVWWQHAQLNIHFLPQTRFQHLPEAASVQYFTVPDQLQALAAAAALPWPLTEMNRSGPLPALTDTQLARVSAIYADDITFYNSVAAQGS